MCQQFVSMHVGVQAYTERDRDTHTDAESSEIRCKNPDMK